MFTTKNYGDNHRFLLRTVMGQSVISVEHLKKLMEKEAGGAVDLPDMIQEVNINIKQLKQQIKIVNDDRTAEDVVVFLSLACDDTSKSQKVFSPIELEYFRVLLDQIMSNNSREIGEMDALKLSNNIKINNRILSMVDAQRLLNMWCRMQYLVLEDKKYILGVRAIHEFEADFIQSIPNAASMRCCICSSIVIRGHNCPYCSKTIHKRCLTAFLKRVQKWPCCNTAYNDSDLSTVGEPRMNDSPQQLESTQQLDLTQGLVETQPWDENGTIYEDSEDSMDTNQPHTSTRSRKRKLSDS